MKLYGEKELVLFHGTGERSIEEFRIIPREDNISDFGAGVYFTSNYDQAKEWSCKHKDKGAVYGIDIDLSLLMGKSLDKEDELFYYALYLNRIGLNEIADDCLTEISNMDYLYGRMLYDTRHFIPKAKMFNEGMCSLEIFKMLTYPMLFNNDYNQYCFRTEKAIQLVNKSIITKTLTIKNKGKIIELDFE